MLRDPSRNVSVSRPYLVELTAEEKAQGLAAMSPGLRFLLEEKNVGEDIIAVIGHQEVTQLNIFSRIEATEAGFRDWAKTKKTDLQIELVGKGRVQTATLVDALRLQMFIADALLEKHITTLKDAIFHIRRLRADPKLIKKLNSANTGRRRQLALFNVINGLLEVTSAAVCQDRNNLLISRLVLLCLQPVPEGTNGVAHN